VQVRFAPLNYLTNATFPTVINNNGNQLEWNSQAIINTELSIDFTDWGQQTKVFVITGAIFQQFTCRLPTYLSEFPHYQLWQLIPSPGSSNYWIPSSTCVDFVWAGFNVIFNLGGTPVEGSATPARDWFYVIGSAPVEVSYGDELPELLQFYSVFNWTSPTQTLTGLFQTTYTAFNGTFYIHDGFSYYQTQVSSPLLVMSYDTTPYATDNGQVIFADGCIPITYSGLSAGWVLIIVFLAGTFLYCTVGIIYKSVRLHAHGIERMPNNEFWQNFPGLVKDGMWWTIAKITCSSGAKATQTYEPVK